MAQIPDYTALGPTPIPTPSYRRELIDQSGAILARGGEALGQGLEQVGNEQYAQQQQQLNLKAQNDVLDHRLAVENAAQTMRQQIASGAVPYAQARDQFDAQVQKIPAPTYDGLNPKVAALLQRQTTRAIAQAQFGIDNAVEAARKDDFKTQFAAGLDKLGKLAGMPDADIDDINAHAETFRPLGRAAGLPDAYISEAIQNFKDRNWLNNATQVAMESKDSMPDLKQLEHDLTASDGFYAGKLDTDKRNMVLRTVINDRLILQNRIEHEQDKREAKAQATLGRIDEQISSGIPATPGMWDQWESLTKGTSFEGEFKQRLADESQVQSVLREPIDQQMKYVQERQQQLETQGGTLRDRANLIRLQTAVNQNVNLMQKAPLLFAANRNGTDVAGLDFQGLTSDEGRQQFQSQIADRMSTLKALRTQYGPSITPSVLLPQEAGMLTQQLEESTPQDRAKLLVSLRGAMGDDQAYQNAMRQIAPHSPVTAIAGAMVGANAPASTPIWFSPDYAPKLSDVDHVLRGEALLNPASAGKAAAAEQEAGKGALKIFPMPNEASLRADFAAAAHDIFRDRPELGQTYYSVFKDAYASLLAEQGNFSGVGHYQLSDRALDIALGKRVQFNGQWVSVPAGMDPSDFQGFVRNAVASTAHALALPATWENRIRGYGLREVGGLGSGQYMLTNGNMVITTPDGSRPFTVDLRDQYLAARGAHRGTPDYHLQGKAQPDLSMSGFNKAAFPPEITGAEPRAGEVVLNPAPAQPTPNPLAVQGGPPELAR